MKWHQVWKIYRSDSLRSLTPQKWPVKQKTKNKSCGSILVVVAMTGGSIMIVVAAAASALLVGLGCKSVESTPPAAPKCFLDVLGLHM